MRIANIKGPNFSAVYLNTRKISKLDENTNEYYSIPASFLQIDPQNNNDIEALYNVAKYWQNSKYSTNIYHSACEIRNHNELYSKNKIFILTSQLKDFDKLDDTKILGFVQIREIKPKYFFGEHIEVDPSIVNTMTPKYKGVGSAIDQSLKKLCNKMSIFPRNLRSVRNFVKRNGYIEDPTNSNLFIWYRDIFDRK